MSEEYTGVVKTAQEYYNSEDADQFYFNIWGGEDIHVGLYKDDEEPILDAGHRTVERMAACLDDITADTRIVDVGAGYGGAARWLAKKYGCFVSCLNLSEVQNERNRRMNKEQGLEHLIEVIDGNFEALPYQDESFDVVWSQDSFLHSGNRVGAIQEAARVLKKGGELIFTDPMQKDDCPPGVLQPVLERIHLDTLGSFDFYRKTAAKLGLEEVNIIDLSEYLPMHYGRVRKELQRRYDSIIELSSKAYVDRMIQGLGHWVDAGGNGYLAWGILHFRKS